jgi:DNA-binding GntR family transcriptional regulator/AcrR family transcriptional regulator
MRYHDERKPSDRMSESNSAKTQRGRNLLLLREMVLKGNLQPRKRLEDIDLGRQLGVSRRVLLSMLEELHSEGLLEELPSGGYLPRQFTFKDISDAILARASLEALAGGLAAQRIQSDEEVGPARRLNAELVTSIVSDGPHPPTAEEMARFGDLNAAFHSAVVELARSPMLTWSIQRILALAFASPAAVVIPVEGNGAIRAFEEHEAILNAIQSRNAPLAEALVRQHADLAIQAIERALDGQVHSSRNFAVRLVSEGPRKQAPKGRKPLQEVPQKKPATPAPTSELVLDAAADLFCRKGFFATTTRELAAKLEIRQASLYHHMRNKEDLLYRVCQQVSAAFTDEVPAAVGKTEDTGDRIGTWIDAHLSVAASHPSRTLAVVTESRALTRPHYLEMEKRYEKYSHRLEAEVRVSQEAGKIRTDIPAKYIRLALLNILNWTPRWFHPQGALSWAELSGIYSSVFWNGAAHANASLDRPTQPVPVLTGRHVQRELHRGTLGKFIRIAAESFSKHGYESTSTRSLATILGMEKATLYYHVNGKEDLLYAICKASIEQLNLDVDEAIDGVDDPLEQLQVWIQAHVVSLLRNQTQHATSLAEARALSPDRLAEIVNMRKAYQTRIRMLIERGQKAGQLRTDIASKYLGQLLEGLLDGTVVWHRRGGDLSPSQLASFWCSLFVMGSRLRT